MEQKSNLHFDFTKDSFYSFSYNHFTSFSQQNKFNPVQSPPPTLALYLLLLTDPLGGYFSYNLFNLFNLFTLFNLFNLPSY